MSPSCIQLFHFALSMAFHPHGLALVHGPAVTCASDACRVCVVAGASDLDGGAILAAGVPMRFGVLPSLRSSRFCQRIEKMQPERVEKGERRRATHARGHVRTRGVGKSEGQTGALAPSREVSNRPHINIS
jgi:hypothetical protein